MSILYLNISSCTFLSAISTVSLPLQILLHYEIYHVDRTHSLTMQVAYGVWGGSSFIGDFVAGYVCKDDYLGKSLVCTHYLDAVAN